MLSGLGDGRSVWSSWSSSWSLRWSGNSHSYNKQKITISRAKELEEEKKTPPGWEGLTVNLCVCSEVVMVVVMVVV